MSQIDLQPNCGYAKFCAEAVYFVMVRRKQTAAKDRCHGERGVSAETKGILPNQRLIVIRTGCFYWFAAHFLSSVAKSRASSLPFFPVMMVEPFMFNWYSVPSRT